MWNQLYVKCTWVKIRVMLPRKLGSGVPSEDLKNGTWRGFLWPNECRTISGQARSRLLSHPIQMVVAEKRLVKDVRDSFEVCNSKLHPYPQSYPLVIPCQIGTCCTNGCKQKRSRLMRKDSSGRYGNRRSSRMACSNLCMFQQPDMPGVIGVMPGVIGVRQLQPCHWSWVRAIHTIRGTVDSGSFSSCPFLSVNRDGSKKGTME